MRKIFYLLIASILIMAGVPKVFAAERLYPVIKNKKFGYINAAGKIVIEPKFDNAFEFTDDLAIVKMADKYGYIDRKGDVAIQPQFSMAFPFSEDLALVELDWEFAYIDKQGKVVIGPRSGKGGMFRNGVAYIYDGDKGIFIDKNGNTVREGPSGGEPWYDFSEGFAVVIDYEVGRMAYMDEQGNIAFAARFDEAMPFSEGLAPVVNDGKLGYIDKTGDLVIAPFSSLGGRRLEDLELSGIDIKFHEGLALAYSDADNAWGFIDKSGKMVIKPQFSEALPFSEGLAAVSTGAKWGYINNEGKMVIQPKFDKAFSFFGGLAHVDVKQAGNMARGYIDKSGNYIWKPAN